MVGAVQCSAVQCSAVAGAICPPVLEGTLCHGAICQYLYSCQVAVQCSEVNCEFSLVHCNTE